MFKPGQHVKISPEFKDIPFYTNQKFTIIRYTDRNVVEVDKYLKLPEYQSKKIHTDYLILNIKENRKQKLKKLWLNLEIE
jgi:hypothetical protein